MSFLTRQRELAQRLQWAPSRGPRRQALLDELRALVTEELRREVTAPRQPDLLDQAEPYRREPRPFYWLERGDEARP